MTRLIWLIALGFALGACNVNRSPPQRVDSLPAGAQPTASQTALPQNVISAADAEYLLLGEIYQRVSPSVVNIEARALVEGGAARRGSGFIYDRQGHIITNAHLVLGADAIQVTLRNAIVLDASLVGADSFSDLAVLKVEAEAERLPPLRIGESATVAVGQRAIVIGNPFGLNSSMTTGIVSGLGRTLPAAELGGEAALPGFGNPAIIQIDAAIHPGNSGGPALDSRGLAIGITTAMQTETGRFQGVGFAVPADTMRRVIPELIARGRVDYAWMGISVMQEDGGYGVAGLSRALELPVERGVLLRGVNIGSPAHQAGLRGGERAVEVRGETVCAGGDLIIAINDHYFADLDGLAAWLVQNARPGDEVELLVIREGQTLEVALTLAERPAQESPILDCSAGA